MKAFKLLKNPIIKNIGIIIILYFALFHNKSNPDSLGVRLSGENLKKGAEELKNRAAFIATNVSEAQKFAEQKQRIIKEDERKVQILPHSDLAIGDGEFVASCGDEAIISYQVLNDKNEILDLTDSNKIKIGVGENLFLENKIIGMKSNGIREIKVPKSFLLQDEKLQTLLTKANSDLKFQVTVSKINPKGASRAKCF